MAGNGGGRVGAVLLSPYIKPGSVNDTPYNHYSLLRSTEDMFGLSHLAYAAQDGLKPFGDDVFNAAAGAGGGGGGGGGGGAGGGSGGTPPTVTLKRVPRGCVSHAFTVGVRARSSSLKRVNVMLDRRRIASRTIKSFDVRVRVAGLRPGHHRVTARASDTSGRAARRTAVFRVCR
jgi:hypothetical protein